MNLLLDPNVAYLILVVGFILAMLAIITPGTGLFEIGAVFALLLSAYSFYNIPLNYWAIPLILIAGGLFFLAILRKSGQGFLLSAILLLVIGSAFLFRSEKWWVPSVNPILTVVVSVLSSGFLWLAGRKALEASLAAPRHDLHMLIGATGEAKSDINPEGTVQVAGELWSAISQSPIPAGNMVRVVGREGFLLKVEKID
ncbi:MAG: NfeD family protein [Chloroflexota bacterium]